MNNRMTQNNYESFSCKMECCVVSYVLRNEMLGFLQ